MGISPNGVYWGCWRSRNHRGSDVARLLRALGVDEATIARIEQDDESPAMLGAGSILERFKRLDTPQASKTRVAAPLVHLEYPDDIQPFLDDFTPDRFIDFACGKYTLTYPELRRAVNWYDIAYALTGAFTNRIIMPFMFQGRRVGWSGRAVGQAEIRYKAYPPARDENDISPVKQVLFNFDFCDEGGDVLVITEGQFKSLKIELAGHRLGIKVGSTALGSSSTTDAQIGWLKQIAPKWDHLVLMPDNDDAGNWMRYRARSLLYPYHFDVLNLPAPHKDPDKLGVDAMANILDAFFRARAYNYLVA